MDVRLTSGDRQRRASGGSKARKVVIGAPEMDRDHEPGSCR